MRLEQGTSPESKGGWSAGHAANGGLLGAGELGGGTHVLLHISAEASLSTKTARKGVLSLLKSFADS